MEMLMTATTDTPAAASFPRIRIAADVLRGLEWVVAEAATFSGGSIDVSAQRRFNRPPLGATVRLAVFCNDTPAGDVTILDTPAVDATPASYALGDDDRSQREAIARALAPYVAPAVALAALHAAAYPHERSLVEPCRVPAPPARLAAGSLTGLDPAPAYAAIDALRADLLAFDLDVIADDLSLIDDADERAAHAAASLAFRAASCDLLHIVLLTDAAIPAPSIRLVRTPFAGAELQWIDVVESGAAADYFARITSHYDAQFRGRHFTRD
jgi:hypothetical protein